MLIYRQDKSESDTPVEWLLRTDLERELSPALRLTFDHGLHEYDEVVDEHVISRKVRPC